MSKKILETKRLILEVLNDEYFEDLCELLANKKVHKYFPKTFNREESKEFLLRIEERERVDGTSFWAVIRKEDKQFLGICGLLKQTIDDIEEIEVGYRIKDMFWGQGYGTEAAKGCLDYAKNVLKLKSVISLILPVNKQSIRVAEKNKLSFEKEAIFNKLIHSVYRISFI